MEELFRTLVSHIALAVEAGAVLFIVIGAAEAVFQVALRVVRPSSRPAVRRKQIWVRFAVWLLLALEFELAADVLRTTIAPSWDDIGQLASIAVIRTFLNYFLEKDIDKYEEAAPVEAASGVSTER